MKKYNTLKIISILSYALIILKGFMIGIPLIVVLAFSLFDIQTLSSLYAIPGVAGLICIFVQRNRPRTNRRLLLETLSFFFLLIPLVERLTAVPIHLFNYGLFIVPTVIFVLFYLLYLLLFFLDIKKEKNLSVE